MLRIVKRAGRYTASLRARSSSALRTAANAACRPITPNSKNQFHTLESRLLLAASDVVINEIMYNSGAIGTADEYVELLNKGTTPIDISSWKLSKGVDYTFAPGTTLNAGAFLVVAADLAQFSAEYPSVTNVVGPWTGHLSNSADTIKLFDNQNQQIDQVDYANDGDWALRTRSPKDNGFQGWMWTSGAAGGGKSLELIDPALNNNQGENWGASIPNNGTPGQPNSIAASNVAPLISSVANFPIIPKSTDTVTITAKIEDEQTTGASVQLFYRNDGTLPFSNVPMFDDGLHGDGSPNDGVYGAHLTARPNGTIVEFYVQATDSSSLARTWPAPTDTAGTQGANALYQVDDTTPYIGNQQIFRIIMTAAEATELTSIRTSGGASDAQMNATFINVDADSTDLRYLIGVRNRGGGSRNASVGNYRIDFGDSNIWHSQSKINLNAIYSSDEVVASALLARSGVPAQSVTAVQVRVNAQNLAGASNMFGSYSYVEAEDSQMVNRLFPTDNQGDYYRGVDSGHAANLSNSTFSTDKYPKETNSELNDYSDLHNLINVLDTTKTPDAGFEAAVNAAINVPEWMRYFAVNVLLGNGETALGTGVGDDFAMYSGVSDKRFQLVAHDLDTVLNFGDTNVSQSRSIFVATNVASVSRLMRWPTFAAIYFQQLKDLIDNVWTPTEIDHVIHHALDGYVPASSVTSLIADANARMQQALAQIPQALVVATTPGIVNGYPRVSNAASLNAMTLSGVENVLTTRSILVNGQPAALTLWKGTWTITNSANALGLVGGLNRILVQALDGNGKETGRTFVDVFYSSPAGTAVSGAITGDVTWSPANGPYKVAATLTINAGASLTILPGTSVYFANNSSLTVNGLLTAVGTDTQHIRFSHAPNGNIAPNWIGIIFNNSAQPSKIAYADIEFAGVGTAAATQIASSKVDLDHDTWNNDNTSFPTLAITGSADFTLTNSILGNSTLTELLDFSGTLPTTGRAIIQGNIFGTTTGFNDIIHVTGGNRSAGDLDTLQILNNIFTGASPTGSILNLQSTGAHIEGNLFLNVAHNGTGSNTTSAISASQNAGSPSQIVSMRNYFYNVDLAFLIKEGSTVLSSNDTFANIGTAPFDFFEPGNANTFAGAGGYANGDLFYQIPTDSGGMPVIYQNAPDGAFPISHSIAPGTLIPGNGNLNLDPQLVNPTGVGPANSNVDPTLIGTAIALSSAFQTSLNAFVQTSIAAPNLSLKPLSPAKGAGPNGTDIGAAIPANATISGEPLGVTTSNSATLTVGGPSILGYQYRLDNGAWSAFIPVTNPLTANAVIPPIVLSNLSNGPHIVSVIARNDVGLFQPMTSATISKTWTVNTALPPHIRINEVLANNSGALNNGGAFPDAIELYNDSSVAVDLSDYSISDDPAAPRKFIFPAGTTIAPGNYLVLYADDPSSAPGIHLGFNLSSTGEGVYLYGQGAGAPLIDSVVFGLQLPNESIGRVGDGTTWALTSPTFGSANIAAPIGDPTKLKLNEWQAAGAPPFSSDFIELYNPTTLPVSLGGMYMTDQFIGLPAKHQFTPLSFAPAGFLKLTADGDTSAGADHLNFQLDHDRGEIALLDQNLKTVDYVYYAAQRAGVSEGLLPDGSGTYIFFNQPSPGQKNVAPAIQFINTPINLIPIDNTWTYDQTSQYASTGASPLWYEPAFDTTGPSWASGQGILVGTSISNYTLPYPIKTNLNLGSPLELAMYFRTHFNLSADPSTITSLTATAFIDDGAVLYLNGHEIKRYNMPAGDVAYSTLASSNIANAPGTVVLNLPTAYLQQGDNVLSVEVHQSSAASSDIVFGLILDAVQTTVAPTASPLRITELMYNPPGSKSVTGDEYEYIELQNTGVAPLSLSGYQLANGINFTFGDVTLAPGAKTVVVKAIAAFTSRYGSQIPIAGQYQDSLDNGGEAIQLLTDTGAIVQNFLYADSWYPSTDGKGDALVINNPLANVTTWSSASSWHPSTSTLGSPGIDESATPPTDAVVVNEVLANSTGPNDWIELKNTTSAPIDISGWYLSDSASNLLKYAIPADTVIPANGFVTFSQLQTFGSIYQGANAFALSETGDDVYLSLATAPGVLGAYRTTAHFGASAPGVTMGRYATSVGVEFVALSKATHGAENAYPLVGPVVINELMYHPSASGDEWIELKNITSQTVQLYDPANPQDTWKISDGVSFTFPTGISLAPGEIILVIPSTITPSAFRTKYGLPPSLQILGGYTGSLSNSGENVELTKPGAPQPDLTMPDIQVDDVNYGTATPWPAPPNGTGPSLARFVESNYGNDPTNWRASTTNGGTAGAANDSSPLSVTGQFIESAAHQLVFQFSKNVSLSVNDLQLTNLTTGQPISASDISLDYDANSNVATFTFPNFPGGRLPTGRYTAVLDGYTLNFIHLPGDANGDGKVDFIDFQTIETHYGLINASWSQGDFNGDSVVDRADLSILLSNQNTSLPIPAKPPQAAPQPAVKPVFSTQRVSKTLVK